MNSTQLNLETVTPMFLRGSDNNTPELRPPAFKALFRYWWRATQVNTKYKALYDKEGKSFGKTGKKSPLIIRISGSEKLTSKGYQPLPHHTGGWGCANCPNKDKPCKKHYENEAYSPGEQFAIRFTTDSLNALTNYENIAKLGFLLGGVGNRSRRGFGSIRDVNWSFANISQLKNDILLTLDNITRLGQFVIDTAGESIVSRPGFLEYPVIRKIFFGQPTTDLRLLLKNIGQATHDHDDDALGYARKKRLASPIHVRIQKVGTNYLPIVTLMHWNYQGYSRLADLKQQRIFIDAIIS